MGKVGCWDIERLPDRGCPLCGTNHTPVFCRGDGMPMAFCRECGLWFTARVPDDEQLRVFYDSYWTDIKPSSLGKVAARNALSRARTSWRIDRRILVLDALVNGLGGRKVLDLGAGLGEFALSLREAGAVALVQDTSSQACEYLRDYHGLSVYRGLATEALAEFAPLDAVTMFELVEHLSNPLELFAVARKYLKPGGILFISTPNGGEGRRDWVGFQRDYEHLQYFSDNTIMTIALRQGWEIAHLEVAGTPQWVSEYSPRPVKDRVAPFVRELPRVAPVLRAARRLIAALRGAPEPAAHAGRYVLFAALRVPQQDLHAMPENCDA